MKERTFVPSYPEKSMVEKWTWTKSKGLVVHYKDGIVCCSAYTLPELLATNYKPGDGLPAIEVKGK